MIIFSIVFIIIVVYIIYKVNVFVRLKHKVLQSKSSIDIYLNQRFDLIPNLVECVKGYSKHEETTFVKIAQMRSEYDKDPDKDLKKGAALNQEFNN